MNVTIIYKTDAWHSYASRDIIAIALNKRTAIKLCKAQAKKEGEKISAQELWNLENIHQTQGYSGDGEFQIESIEINRLI